MLLLNNHISKNTVSADIVRCTLLTNKRSPKLRRSTRSGGISNKSSSGLIENITAQITPVLIAIIQGFADALGSAVPMVCAK